MLNIIEKFLNGVMRLEAILLRFLTKRTVDPTTVHSCPGKRLKTCYSPYFDGKNVILTPSGTLDVQDEINSHAMECDINYILNRLSKGDLSVINNNNPMYADFKNLPENFRECFDIAFNAERIFNSLDVETRKKFDNDYRQFIYSAGSEEFNKILGIAPADSAPADPAPVDPAPADPVSGS